ncbi:hypothetical protein R1sor_010142 [Riccia sorocarpa]|uniref:Reverse transcriptase domain-containing protein n=1 Tax=Riccia sorocarpa TaxID=122646 RepID=A0ABD3HYQ9_9MARC
MAKLVACRLALLLPLITPREQQGFVKRRSIFNCILTFCMVHEALKRTRRSALFFSLNQEKAYDRLLPQFLWETMRKLGFSEHFLAVIKSLQTDAESRLLVNGRVLPPFLVGRGVRQGCLLSPLLFVITTIPAFAAMRSENEKGRIQPLKLGNGLAVSCIALADDFAFFTEIDRRDVDNLLLLLSQLETALGAKINLKKSKLILIGRQLRFPAWTRQLGFTLVGSNDVTNYLGAPFTTIGKGTTKGAALTVRMEEKTKCFSSPFLSFDSRILIAKHALFPTLIWKPTGTASRPTELLREQIFLMARSKLGLAEASEMTTSLVAACRENGIITLQDLRDSLTNYQQDLNQFRKSDVNLLNEIFAMTWQDSDQAGSLDDWSENGGAVLPLTGASRRSTRRSLGKEVHDIIRL